MKIGFVIDDTLDSSDGVQQYVLLLGKWLSSQGHDVSYLAGHTIRTDIINIHSLARNIKVGFNKNKLSMPLLASKSKINNLLSSERYDVLHVQMPYSPFLAGKIISAAPKNTSIVATFHIAPHTKLVENAARLLALVQLKSLQRINVFISVSEVAKKFAKATYSIDSRVIPNAVDTTMWRNGKNKRHSKQLVFVGRLVERKGAIYLLKAFKKLVRSGNKDARLIIAGDGPHRFMLENFVNENNLMDRVSFLGYVTEEQKQKLLQESAIAIFPSTGGESFGIVLIEAMAARALVLGGNNPGYSSVLQDAQESLFDPNDTHKFAELIQHLFDNQKLYNKLLAQQQALVRQFDIQNVGNDILSAYKDAIKKQKEQYGK